MPKDNAVYQGFWTNRLESFPNRWFLTLSDDRATFFQLFLGLYVIYAGDRTWAWLRRKAMPGVHSSYWTTMRQQQEDQVWSHTDDEVELESPITLDNADDPLPSTERPRAVVDLLNDGFSPNEAIEAFLGIRVDKARVRMLREEFSARYRTIFALIAVFVCLVTAVLAPLIPWLASEKGNKSPVVLSKWTPGCGGSQLEFLGGLLRKSNALEAERRYVDCFSTRGCDDDVFQNPFPEVTTAETECPFASGICVQGQQAMRLERRLLPRDIGYNSPSQVSFHQALSCSPIDTEQFTIPPYNHTDYCSGWLWFLRHDIDDDDYLDVVRDYVARICTPNGPNKFSSDLSGWNGQSQDKHHVRSMDVDLIPSQPPTNRSGLRNITPYLYRADGTSFVALFYAGYSTFLTNDLNDWGPIEDPIFSAHRLYESQEGDYLPDREVTALGCVEQFRFCHLDECSAWIGNVVDDLYIAKEDHWDILPHDNSTWCSDECSITEDLFLLYRTFFTRGSVARYLSLNTKFIIAKGRHNSRRVEFVDQRTQWQREAEAWFDTAFIFAHTDLFNMIARHPGFEPEATRTMNNKVFCESLLFRDKDYIRFNVVVLAAFFMSLSIPVMWNLVNKKFYVRTARILICNGWNLAKRIGRKICSFARNGAN